MLRRTVRWVGQQVKEFGAEGKALDIGSYCVSDGIMSLFPDYTGVDLHKGPSVNLVMDAYDISKHFKCGSFDIVLCLYVLEHLPDINGILEQVDYVLKEGGYFYVSVPLFDYPAHDYPSKEPKDYWRFSEKTVREIIMKGYDIVASERGRGNRPGAGPVFDCLGRKL